MVKVGDSFVNNRGMKFTVVEYNGARDVLVRFDSCGSLVKTRNEAIYSKEVTNRIPVKHSRKYFIGQRFYSKKWGVAEVVKLHGNSEGDIKFHGKYSCTLTGIVLSNLAKGLVKNPLVPYKNGGYFGIGAYSSNDPAYRVWAKMLQRVSDGRLKSYSEVIVAEDWLNFQTFAKDYNEMLSECQVPDPQLDKDLFSTSERGNLYSKKTCCILPHSLNTAIQLTCLSSKSSNASFGVCELPNGRYRAQISMFGETKHIGVYSKDADARIAHIKAKRDYLNSISNSYIGKLPDRTLNQIKLKMENLLCK